MDMRLPEWFDSMDGLTSDNSRQMIVQFRVLFEAFIVLAIMTGYREAVIDFVKFIYKILWNSKKSKTKSKVSETTVY
uniref:Uncharacterized protein n=1 Tax=Panagrolaimus sp. ES5 TaxID=591445 RepID=A0AC34FIE3_9BILA